MTGPVRPAQLAWRGGQPYAVDFRDVYHAADGAQEVRRVFTEPSGLPGRFSSGSFVIGELGFGTGLNFAVTASQFLESGTGGRLHFVSFELHPLRAADFRRAAVARSGELPIYEALAAALPPLVGGWHRRHFHGGRITLSVFHGDAASGLDDLIGRARPFDAWFLDGFAPDRNPLMWTPAVFESISALSGGGTTIATFTAAGHVRRGLAAAGFSVERLDQRPHKRHTLRGTYHKRGQTPYRARSVTVVGAGIAGAAAARRLAELDVNVTVLEAGTQPANPLPGTVLHPRLRADHSPAARLRLVAYDYARHALADWLDPERPGVLQLPGPNWGEARMEKAVNHWASTGDWLRALTTAEASELLGRPCQLPGVHFPGGANINLAALCTALTDHPNITVQAGVEVAQLERGEPVILCAGHTSNQFDASCYLEVLPMWGQLELIQLATPPRLPVLADGYLASSATATVVGATYERGPWDTARASAANLERFVRWWTAAIGSPPDFRATGQVRGVRSVTSDRLPIIGELHDAGHTPLPELRVSTGHGSAGTSFALLGGECVASDLAGEFAPLTRGDLRAVSGLRFLERQARRGVRHGARPLQ